MYVAGYSDEGEPTFPCTHCGALFWYGERVKKDKKKRKTLVFSMCCQHGQVVKLFFDKSSSTSRNFIDNVRQYNNMFAFTSMGGHIEDINKRGSGPYSYVMSGMNYHSIGCLLPDIGSPPVFSQLYKHDTANEVANRISAVRLVVLMWITYYSGCNVLYISVH